MQTETDPAIEEMVELLKNRRFLPFGPTAFTTILIELLERPLSKNEMQKLTHPNAQVSFFKVFGPTQAEFIRPIFAKNRQGRDVIKYELTEKGREFALQQLDLIKTFYKASGKKEVKK